MSLLIALFLLVSIAIALFIAFNLIIVIRAEIPETPRTIVTGKKCSLATEISIPRIIWTYWHELPLPYIVGQCQKNWHQYAPDHAIRVINKNNIDEWIKLDTIPEYFHRLPPYRQADWLRLQLLAQYGGVWIDASIILTRNLNWVHEILRLEDCEYVGFYIDRFTNRSDKPIVENWFMASIAKSKFITDLALEFNHAIEHGERSYLKAIADNGKLADIVQLIAPAKMQEYLIMHVAASVLLDRNVEGYKLALLRAEDTAFGFHSRLRWSKKLLHIKLALVPCPKKLSFIIKLRGGERNRIERYLTRGWYYRGSLLAKFLSLTTLDER